MQTEALTQIKKSIENAKNALISAENWIEKIQTPTQTTSAISQQNTDEDTVFYGVFNGKEMIAEDGTLYNVPQNYASKSKLIEGDELKLMIAENGAFIFKLIKQAPRQFLTGKVILDGSQYKVLCNEKEYFIPYASITFFKLQVSDKVTIVAPIEASSQWAAIENVNPV